MPRLCVLEFLRFWLAWVAVVGGLLGAVGRAGADEAAEQLVLATYKLANERSTATGTAFRWVAADGAERKVVVTAGHVLEQMQGDGCIVVGRTRLDDGTYQRRDVYVPIRREGSPLWRKHAAIDLAVLPLPADAPLEALPLDSLMSEQRVEEMHTGDAVRLAVFPERSEANGAGFPYFRGGVIASFPLNPVKRHADFLVDTTTWTGDSGGPVMHATLRSASGGPLVVGIVRGMRSITDVTKESRFVERRTNYPLGISEVMQAAFALELVSAEQSQPQDGD